MRSTDTERHRVAGNSFPVDVWVTLKRWLQKAVRNASVVFEALLSPFIFLILFTQVFGKLAGGPIQHLFGADVNYVLFLTPAIIVVTAMTVAIQSGTGLIQDMDSGMFDTILVSPTHRGAIFLGKALADVIRIVFQSTIVLVLGYVLLWIDSGGSVGTYVETGVGGMLGMLAIVIVYSLWFTAFSIIIALVTQDIESASIWMYMTHYPLLFSSSAFLPIRFLPEWMQIVATVNPVTYGVDALRALMIGQDVLTVIDVTAFSGVWNTIVPAVLVLGVLDVVLGGIAAVLLCRLSSSQVS